jgi:hypothetical protein
MSVINRQPLAPLTGENIDLKVVRLRLKSPAKDTNGKENLVNYQSKTVEVKKPNYEWQQTKLKQQYSKKYHQLNEYKLKINRLEFELNEISLKLENCKLNQKLDNNIDIVYEIVNQETKETLANIKNEQNEISQNDHQNHINQQNNTNQQPRQNDANERDSQTLQIEHHKLNFQLNNPLSPLTNKASKVNQENCFGTLALPMETTPSKSPIMKQSLIFNDDLLSKAAFDFKAKASNLFETSDEMISRNTNMLKKKASNLFNQDDFKKKASTIFSHGDFDLKKKASTIFNQDGFNVKTSQFFTDLKLTLSPKKPSKLETTEKSSIFDIDDLHNSNIISNADNMQVVFEQPNFVDIDDYSDSDQSEI